MRQWWCTGRWKGCIDGYRALDGGRCPVDEGRASHGNRRRSNLLIAGCCIEQEEEEEKEEEEREVSAHLKVTT